MKEYEVLPLVFSGPCIASVEESDSVVTYIIGTSFLTLLSFSEFKDGFLLKLSAAN